MHIGAGSVEIVKRGVARYDFSDPYHIAIELSWKEFAFAFIGLELGINIAFALLYLASPGCIANARPGSFSDAFFFSIETLATVGYGVMAPATFYGHVVQQLKSFAAWSHCNHDRPLVRPLFETETKDTVCRSGCCHEP